MTHTKRSSHLGGAAERLILLGGEPKKPSEANNHQSNVWKIVTLAGVESDKGKTCTRQKVDRVSTIRILIHRRKAIIIPFNEAHMVVLSSTCFQVLLHLNLGAQNAKGR